MTSFVAWIGVDQRGPSSLYFAADSRISWPQKSRWDHARKVFAATRSAHLLGFVGHIAFPSIILSQIVALIDSGAILEDHEPPELQFAAVSSMIQDSFVTFPDKSKGTQFTIMFGMRYGDNMKSSFHVFALDYTNESWSESRVPLPDRSDVLQILGSGRQTALQWQNYWSRTSQGGTSRAVFGAFCDAIRSESDPLSGGAPQLAGIYRVGSAKNFGVVFRGQSFLSGLPITNPTSIETIEWRNELFERCDASGILLARAQRHVAPRGLGPTR